MHEYPILEPLTMMAAQVDDESCYFNALGSFLNRSGERPGVA